MAHNRKKILEQAKALIESESLLFVEDIVSLLPISRTTFYSWFPAESDESDTIKELLDNNRVKTKVAMREKWENSKNATLQIALYKLICTDEEAHRLNGSKIKADVTSGGKEIQDGKRYAEITVNFVKPLDDDELY